MKHIDSLCAKCIGVFLLLVPNVCAGEGWHYDKSFPHPLAGVDTLNFRYAESPDWSQFGGTDADRYGDLFALFEGILRKSGIILVQDPATDYRIPLLFVVNSVNHWSNEPFMTFSPEVCVIGLVEFNGRRMPGTIWTDKKVGYCAFPPQPECLLNNTLSSLASELSTDFRSAGVRKKAGR